RPLYLRGAGRADRIASLQAEPLAYPPRTAAAYSCPGYILLGLALERAGGEPIDQLFAGRVSGPLGLPDLLYRPGAALRPRTAATEQGNVRERSLAGPEGAGYNGWRTGVIWGEVHDHNAWTLDGRSANAGLFGTVRAIHRVALEILAEGRGLVPE